MILILKKERQGKKYRGYETRGFKHEVPKFVLEGFLF